MNNKEKVINVGLCKNRHKMYVEGKKLDLFIFDHIDDVTDVKGIEDNAKNTLKTLIYGLESKSINLYVTGLAVALISVINACKALGININLMHYDKVKKSYYMQKIYF